MGKALVACLLLAACQGMYSAGPEHMRNPTRVKPPPGWDAEQKQQLAYIDQCDVDFTAKPTTKRQTAAAEKLVASGNVALQTAGPTAATTPVAAHATADAITMYREALVKDPYNAEATLKLALAYDHMLRKGCALAMLKRLSALAENDKLASDARPKIELVRQNDGWFPDYRITALNALGY